MSIKWLTQRELILKRSLNGVALWDYDGAISTSEPIQIEAYRLLLDQHNVEAEQDLRIKYLVNKTSEQSLAQLKTDYQLTPTVDELLSEKNDIVDELISLTGEPTWFLAELISHLNNQGTEIAILSNGQSSRIKKAWNRWNLAETPTIYTKDLMGEGFNKKDMEKELIKQDKAKIVFEGNIANLSQAKKMEVFAVGIKSRSNGLTDQNANLVLDLSFRTF